MGGSLPLHIAFITQSGDAYGTAILSVLYNACPDGAQERNDNGELPFVCAKKHNNCLFESWWEQKLSLHQGNFGNCWPFVSHVSNVSTLTVH